MNPPALEREIKLLALRPLSGESVRGVAREAGIELAPVRAWVQTDLYLDTHRRDLARRGIGLRVRQHADRTTITYKAMGEVQGGVRIRPELELPWTSSQPPQTAAELPEGLRHLVEPLVYGRLLVGIARLRTTRESQEAHAPEGRGNAQLVVDQVVVESAHHTADGQNGNGTPGFAEVEIELVGDAAPGFAGFVAQLERQLELTHSDLDKLQRALQLSGEQVEPLASPLLHPETSVAAAARIVLSRYFRRMQAEEPGARDGRDPERLHDLRVAVRRFRSALRLLADTLPEDEFEFLGNAMEEASLFMGRVRDLDVFLQGLPALRTGLPALLQADADALAGAVAARREQAQAELLAWFTAPRRLADWQRIEETLERSGADGTHPQIGAAAAEWILRAARKVFRRGRSMDADAPSDDLHRLRILTKRLRYTIEAFAELYGTGVRRCARKAAALQDVLGAVNDAETAMRWLHHFAEEQGRTFAPRLHMAVGALLTLHEERRRAARGEFAAAWRAFDRGRMRRRLHEALG